MAQSFRDRSIGPTLLVRAVQPMPAATLVEQAARDRHEGGIVEPVSLEGVPRPADPHTLRKGLQPHTPARIAGPTVHGFFDGMMSDMQDAFDGLQTFNPFYQTPPTVRGVQEPARSSPIGTFLEMHFVATAGSRPYKLYVPACYRATAPMPLVVMLHGCTQSPDDFAAGTRMNLLAERDGFLVCYPGQTSSANRSRCWNWFNDGDQRRDRGEPSLIAGITADVIAKHAVDPRRVYVAGLSAGGALAATMGQTYPDLYAAIGVHSGLACGAARDVSSAVIAMRQGGGARAAAAPGIPPMPGIAGVPTIVFHGDRDTTVNPVNGDEVTAQTTHAAVRATETEEGRVPGGHGYTRTRFLDRDGATLAEQWNVHGAGHAWAGGSSLGSYTDPQGPDASREMLRFFAEHPRPA
jgi:poly(hydroxyalkanoate) depolymerase family esterase